MLDAAFVKAGHGEAEQVGARDKRRDGHLDLQGAASKSRRCPTVCVSGTVLTQLATMADTRL